MLTKPLFISPLLWRALQTPPSRHWLRANPQRFDSTALLLLFILAALALISGVILSVLIVARVTAIIARDYENETFDLLAVTPAGGLGASWARFASFLHYELTLNRLNRLRWSALGAVLVIALFTMLTMLVPALQRSDGAMLAETWQWFLFYLFLLPMMVFDHIYAVVSGGLISVLVPTLSSADARVVGVFAAVVLQFSGYLVVALTAALFLPTIYDTFGLHGWLADVSRSLIALGMFVLAHETLAILLYRAAQERLNGSEFDFSLLAAGQANSRSAGLAHRFRR